MGKVIDTAGGRFSNDSQDFGAPSQPTNTPGGRRGLGSLSSSAAGPTTHGEEGQDFSDARWSVAYSPTPHEQGEVHLPGDIHGPSDFSLLYSLQRDRDDFLNEERSLTLRIKARLRRLCDGDKDKANALYKQMESLRKKGDNLSKDAVVALAMNEVLLGVRDTVAAARKEREKRMEKLAHALPCSGFVEVTRGFGWLGYAQIVAEAGDLRDYANPGKLWKRFGLAVIDGKAQRRVKDADKAIEHGFSPKRRAVMWNIGDALVKQGVEYRQVYLDRKEYEKQQHPDAPPIQHHKRAQRYMEKRLLRDLWREWRTA